MDRFAAALQRRFEIDLRALAAFRIALGLLIILDLLNRTRDFHDFHTDAGILPIKALYSDYSDVYSLHALSGEAWVQALLFLIAGAFALAMIFGYRTRFVTIVSWLLLMSLHIRNPMVLNGGDALLRLLVFWGIFLPLGERWSIDAREVDRSRSTVASEATMAVLLQVFLMYATNAIHKYRSDTWMDGEAVLYIFQADHLTILFGNVLADQFMLLRLFTYAWLVCIFASPLLILLTGYPRAALATAFAGMHVGMFLTLRIDLFPLISLAGLLLFYPPVVWDRVDALADRFGIASPLRGRLEWLQRTVPRLPSPSVSNPSIPKIASLGRGVFLSVVPAVFLLLILFSNAAAVDYTEVPDPGEEILDTTKTDQSWRMFAPEPTSNARWLVAPGELENGSEVDALNGGEVTWDRPPSVEQTYESSRWRKYLLNMRYASNENHRSYSANYLCERWNAEHETNIESVTIYGLTDLAEPYDDEQDIARFKLIEYDCSGDFVQDSA
ncbi:HTTM domain-containing protein [Natronosalvus halobius]|uniref:HTTM domain-containing protein n=1 Tax=Natronosalvus halobius TaxID=2953746 RepID=UPI00209CDB43|nr:HTTM domain-containing protein [Natronosalvus halobius]USZ71633.1 HTTM domain-containing protein [Natronosalvus halobius]